MRTNRASCSEVRRDRRRAFLHAFSAGITALAIAVAFTGCSSKTDQPVPKSASMAHGVTLTAAQRKHIQFYTVVPSSYRKSIDTTGVVDFDNDQATSVLAPFSGPVSRLLVSVGQQVRKGQPLATVQSPDFALAISTYRKALATARTTRRIAKLDSALAQHQGISRREQEQAQTDAANAEADEAAALQSLVALDVDPKAIKDLQQGRSPSAVMGVIRSPISGTVVAKQITPGELLQAGTTPCFTVANLSRVWVMAQVFGADVASVNAGDPADVMTGMGSRSLPGTVDNIADEVDPVTRSVAARVVVKNPGDILKKQMYVRVRIHARKQSAGLLVPVSTILRDDENLPFVYLVQPDGRFARRHVTLGYRVGNRYDITAGLHAGEKVVVDGGIFVQFMQSQ